MRHYRDSLTVRFRQRTGHERMDPRNPEPFVIEVGYPVKTAPTRRDEAALLRARERGLMVAMMFSHYGQMPGAMHGAAELWQGFLARNQGVREAELELVRWRIPGGGVGDVQVRPSELAGHLHRFADEWEKNARDAYAEHQATLIVGRQPFQMPHSTVH